MATILLPIRDQVGACETETLQRQSQCEISARACLLARTLAPCIERADHGVRLLDMEIMPAASKHDRLNAGLLGDAHLIALPHQAHGLVREPGRKITHL